MTGNGIEEEAPRSPRTGKQEDRETKQARGVMTGYDDGGTPRHRPEGRWT